MSALPYITNRDLLHRCGNFPAPLVCCCCRRRYRLSSYVIRSWCAGKLSFHFNDHKYNKVEWCLVTAASIIFTRGSIHSYVINISRYISDLDSHITRSGYNFKAVIGMVWSGLVWGSRPDQTSCLHNNRSNQTGLTNKTAKNEAEVVQGERKYIYYYPSILSLSFSLSSLSLSSST